MVQRYSSSGGSGGGKKRGYNQGTKYGQGGRTDYNDQKRVRFTR